ncbi:MAG: arylsulfatase [Desulfobacterales bacterium]|nr:arylsulfatase [Desulfobacterales bacterium]
MKLKQTWKYLTALGALALAFGLAVSVCAAEKKPNILVIWGDDVGISNISAYTRGLVGYQTPNIDRVANGGIIFTDYYAEQSCTAGRSTFITGQTAFRTGLSKVGLPGAPQGMKEQDATIAALLKEQGYATGQFGKNHLGDLDEHLPTKHGFDEFFGNLYHLNAEEEPENEDYPSDLVMADGRPFREAFGPRGVLKTTAVYDENGAVTGQKIEDTGALTKKRMETVDDETLAAAIEFIKAKDKEGTPWFVWWNGTRMHFRVHVTEERRAMADEAAGKHVDEYAAGMIEHDMHVGQFLDLLDELGIADETLVFYSTDNGPHMNTWPDAAWSPFRGEKNTNWEGGFRVPAMARWPGKIEAGRISNEIMHHMDWLPTFLAMAGVDDIKEQLKGDGVKAIGRDYRVHLDGYNTLPYLLGQEEKTPRNEIFYFSDTGDMTALRYDDWKVIFMEHRFPQTMQAWSEPWTVLRMPLLFNLRRDPYERGQITSNTYYDWFLDRVFLMAPAAAYVSEFLATFKEFPPSQKPGSFTIGDAKQKILDTIGSP